jgi:alpha-D-ribose 1-methylphosphonate 5-triphosphate synthase subunit PhnH
MPAAAALLAMLADYETPLWLDPPLARPTVVEWIRFNTGAPLTDDPGRAAFALVSDGRLLPDFGTFAQGSDEYPDRSATVIAQVERFAGEGFVLAGPGLKGPRHFAAAPLPEDFVTRWAANGTLFPRGIDLILVAGDSIAALPRSVRIARRD